MQTAIAARNALETMLKTVPGLEDLVVDAVLPERLDKGFANLRTGGDKPIGSILGGVKTVYEVLCLADLQVVLPAGDREGEAVIRAAVAKKLSDDPTLGGTVDDAEIRDGDNDIDAPVELDPIRVLTLSIEMILTSDSPVG